MDITLADAALLFKLLKTNGHYYQHMHEEPSLGKTEAMLKALPPGVKSENKHNKGLIIDNHLTGFIEYIEHYPDPDCGMIGLLIIDGNHQGQGIGSRLLQWTLDELVSDGLNSIFLSYAKTNQQSQRFWEKHGFFPTGDSDLFDDLELIAMEKQLMPQVHRLKIPTDVQLQVVQHPSVSLPQSSEKAHDQDPAQGQ